MLSRALILFCFASCALASADIPYPDAIAASDVHENKIDSIGDRAILVGNGELNALITSDHKDLRLRVAKNDCWDMRVNTKNDPPMPTIDVATGKVTSGHGSTDSWKTVYSTALPCCEIIVPGVADNLTDATLSLSKAVATITTKTESTDIRVLGQSNVILIHSSHPFEVSFAGILDFLHDKDMNTWVSKADLGTQGDCTYIHQNIPGDDDVSGMDIYVVAGKKDSTQAIAVVTSRDSQHPLEDAVNLVHSTLADANVVAKHETVWNEFWSKSGIQLGDTELQEWWYHMLYFNRVFARAGGNAIGLAACFDHLAGWHNSLKLNYNIQQTYLGCAPTNHPELIEPFIDVLMRNLPRAKWFATTSFIGSEGAFFHSDLFPFEPDPANCKTNCKHQQTYMPYGYSLGMDGHSAVVVWEYYKFSPTAAHLEKVYPLIKEFATFYCSLLEKYPLVNGKRHMGPSFFPEIGGYYEYNVCYDIHFVTACLRIAKEAATLKHDDALLTRVNAVIDQVPGYATQTNPKETDPAHANDLYIQPWEGAGFNVGADRHGTMIQGIFPAGNINWFSSDDMKQIGINTIKRVENCTTHANSNVAINIARARLGLTDDAIANAKMCFSGKTGKYSTEAANGLFHWNAHGQYITEQVAIERFVTELLMQSVGNTIRIFPAWPTATDAHFTDLLAEGGFLVSADQVGGSIANVRIESSVGGPVKVVSPWKSGFTVTEKASSSAVPVQTANGISSFPTEAGKVYLLKQS